MSVGTFILGMALILFGTAMLLINTGYASREMLTQSARLWPVILIVVGLSLFWRGRIPRWFAVLVILALAAGIVAYILLGEGFFPGRNGIKQIFEGIIFRSVSV
ncbi:hypothetical protein Psch_01142 [Pelotomaculum schinkii]|uniref:LiaI-LiaF-like transmembrane region domain-containing protein n=1 Tax=Pelotomaculum schinkii TaxID=78350 RepID=A0A4Y7RH06_9FIRM|nr:DUF5668 domain-containing protein [Pelotomaculum schinkii]TEB07587.1 hypothetical protein Psch_01142 [Pelotomaculum schinkii]